jgi:hypothetical protein
MKKLLLLFGLLSFNQLYSQKILFKKDKFDSKISYIVSNRGLILEDDDDKDIGMFILPKIEKSKNGVFSLKYIYGKVIGLSCLDAVLIEIIFENEEKMTIKNEYNKFNCDGDYYFDLSNKNLQLLSSNNISKIRFITYRKGKSITVTNMKDENKTFLKEVLENIDKVNYGEEVKEYVE